MLNDDDIKIEEIWLPYPEIPEYYKVSNLGRVKSMRKDIIMKHYMIKSGYLCIDLTVNKIKYKKLVHRLVAETFIPNKSNKPEVHHKDEKKTNNKVSNLCWCTSKENKYYSIQSGTYDKIKHTKNSLGKKHLPNPSSKYHNVFKVKNTNRWRAGIMHNKKFLERKDFYSEVEAALHVNYIIDKYQLEGRPKNIID